MIQKINSTRELNLTEKKIMKSFWLTETAVRVDWPATFDCRVTRCWSVGNRLSLMASMMLEIYFSFSVLLLLRRRKRRKRRHCLYTRWIKRWLKQFKKEGTRRGGGGALVSEQVCDVCVWECIRVCDVVGGSTSSDWLSCSALLTNIPFRKS